MSNFVEESRGEDRGSRRGPGFSCLRRGHAVVMMIVVRIGGLDLSATCQLGLFTPFGAAEGCTAQRGSERASNATHIWNAVVSNAMFRK